MPGYLVYLLIYSEVHINRLLVLFHFNLLNGIRKLAVFSRSFDKHSIASKRVPDKVTQFNIPDQDIVCMKVINKLFKELLNY